MILYLFRAIAILEGISYLLLFGIGMPLKHWAGIREPNIYIGYAHGFLFLGFLVLAVLVGMEYRWKFRHYFWAFVASLLPFGTFYLDDHYLKKLAA